MTINGAQHDAIPWEVVVIGASAGGIEALQTIAAALPSDFPAAIFAVVHTSADSSGMTSIFRNGPLPAVTATTGQPIQPGYFYLAPPDHHLIVERGRMRISKGPKENRFRPAVDPLFRSAAQAYGPAATGVVLTGNLDDGTAGLWAIKRLGGTTVVQDPKDALYPSMPSSALRHVDIDHCVPLSEIAPLLTRLTNASVAPTSGGGQVPDDIDIEVQIAREMNALEAGVTRLGTASCYSCPDCHGVLLKWKEANRLRFRCHTGHAYSTDSLIAAIREGIERSLWDAVRSIEETMLLTRELARHAEKTGDLTAAERYAKTANEAQHRSEMVRTLTLDISGFTAQAEEG